MNPMIYYKEFKRILLATGFLYGFQYYIMNLGMHPTAYINLPEGLEITDDDINVHGGITYRGDSLTISDDIEIEGNFIGWDYAHFDDYGGYMKMLPPDLRFGKKWTTEEIFEEVKEACCQIKMKWEK